MQNHHDFQYPSFDDFYIVDLSTSQNLHFTNPDNDPEKGKRNRKYTGPITDYSEVNGNPLHQIAMDLEGQKCYLRGEKILKGNIEATLREWLKHRVVSVGHAYSQHIHAESLGPLESLGNIEGKTLLFINFDETKDGQIYSTVCWGDFGIGERDSETDQPEFNIPGLVLYVFLYNPDNNNFYALPQQRTSTEQLHDVYMKNMSKDEIKNSLKNKKNLTPTPPTVNRDVFFKQIKQHLEEEYLLQKEKDFIQVLITVTDEFKKLLIEELGRDKESKINEIFNTFLDDLFLLEKSLINMLLLPDNDYFLKSSPQHYHDLTNTFSTAITKLLNENVKQTSNKEKIDIYLQEITIQGSRPLINMRISHLNQLIDETKFEETETEIKAKKEREITVEAENPPEITNNTKANTEELSTDSLEKLKSAFYNINNRKLNKKERIEETNKFFKDFDAESSALEEKIQTIKAQKSKSLKEEKIQTIKTQPSTSLQEKTEKPEKKQPSISFGSLWKRILTQIALSLNPFGIAINAVTTNIKNIYSIAPSFLSVKPPKVETNTKSLLNFITKNFPEDQTSSSQTESSTVTEEPIADKLHP